MGQLWALHENGQLWAKMGMRKTKNTKLQIKGQLWVKYDESQQWAKMGLGFKQYHKSQNTNNRPTKGLEK